MCATVGIVLLFYSEDVDNDKWLQESYEWVVATNRKKERA